CQHFWGTPWTF
nr:immunoglobulin light chain junction region [Mus musculus]NSL97407.1 immunoglobulin light chain junction region [Mus musculus]NSL97524.1 immunoglobulin light chain junction region [Mus musculus]NSL97594.1 immunoglobulin light chain junction region [Mus musculus]NSL97787.1 immunoglobulin light chain junction region [Mus musculus]